MKIKSIVCVIAGHRWHTDADVNETYPLLTCLRCGRHREGNLASGGLGTRMDEASKYIDVNIRR
jgi:hypothetical protein